MRIGDFMKIQRNGYSQCQGKEGERGDKEGTRDRKLMECN
jgi:hypothetical protein